MTQKYFVAEYYTNLYKLASQLTDKLFQQTKPIIIFSNCLSLIAGISFNAIKHSSKNIHIVYEWNENTKSLIQENQIVLVAMNLDKFKTLNLSHEEWTFYFEYKGQENNILIC